MKDLLTTIKSKLLEYQGTTLSTISTWKRGVFTPQTGFPVLALMPVSEEIVSRLSGGEYRVIRNINVEIYSKIIEKNKAIEHCESLISAVKDIVQANIDWSDECIDTVMSDEIYETFDDKYQTGLLSLACRSTESRATGTTVTSMVEVASDTLVQYIYDTIVGYKNPDDGRTPTLNEVKNFFRSYEYPIYRMPSVTLLQIGLTRERKWAGQDYPRREFKLIVQTPLHEKETNLDLNIDIIEKLKDIIQKNYRWNTYAWNTDIDRIDFFTEDKFPSYRTEITFFVDCVEPL